METIKLNVGGTIFETNLKTLKERSMFFKGMFDHEWKDSDSSKIVFIDRCPVKFREILNNIRDPSSLVSYESYDEAEFYGIKITKQIYDLVGSKTITGNPEISKELEIKLKGPYVDKLLKKHLRHLGNFVGHGVDSALFQLILNGRFSKNVRFCTNTFVRYPMSNISGIYNTVISTTGDVINNIFIEIRYKSDHVNLTDRLLRYKIIKGVNAHIGAFENMKHNYKKFFIYDMVEKTQTEHNLKLDLETETIVLKMSLQKIPLNTIGDNKINIQFDYDVMNFIGIEIEQVDLVVEWVLVDPEIYDTFIDIAPAHTIIHNNISESNERDVTMLFEHLSTFHISEPTQVVIGEEFHTLTFNYGNIGDVITKWYFSIFGDDFFEPISIESIKLICNNICILDVSERMIWEQMLTRNDIPGYKIYAWEQMGPIESSRTSDFKIEIRINSKYDPHIKKLCYFTKNYNIRKPHQSTYPIYKLPNDLY